MPRAGLTRSLVISEAARLADEVGMDQRFGVRVPSLYKHIDGLDAVRRGVAILGTRELGEAMSHALVVARGEAPIGDRTARLRVLADAYRSYARDHPGRYTASLRASTPGDAEHMVASDAVLGIVLDILAERGVSGDDAIDAARALRSMLHGFVALEMAGGFGLPRDVERSFGRAVELLDRGLDEFAARDGSTD
jgi:hypothetical protein